MNADEEALFWKWGERDLLAIAAENDARAKRAEANLWKLKVAHLLPRSLLSSSEETQGSSGRTTSCYPIFLKMYAPLCIFTLVIWHLINELRIIPNLRRRVRHLECRRSE